MKIKFTTIVLATFLVSTKVVFGADECSTTPGVAGGTYSDIGVCRAAVSACDVAESCSGALDCPADAFQSNTHVARAAANDCDVAETCSGTDSVVPADGFKAQGAVCRAAATVCDVAETCPDASGTACPTDAFQPNTHVARAAVSACDVAETCSGTDSVVPVDGFAPSTKLIHASTSNDNCDPAEYCSGTDSVVPANNESCTKAAVDVLGQSGKFTIYDKTKGKEDPNRVTVELDYLYEMHSDGVTKVGNTGSTKHSIQTFASQAFTIDNPVDTTVPGNNAVHAQKVKFYSTVSTIGKITVDTYILKSKGTIGVKYVFV
jgi:hypothetical protein